MKRLWIAAILLCALLGATLANAWYLGHLTGELTAALEESEALARRETGRGPRPPRRRPSGGGTTTRPTCTSSCATRTPT